jgi:glycosyltransferase involved in cell wall biosynthesis
MAGLTWIEVSELLRPGVARTGITRVVANLVIRYADRPKTRFFQYVPRLGALEPIERATVLAALADSSAAANATSPGKRAGQTTRSPRIANRGRAWLSRQVGGVIRLGAMLRMLRLATPSRRRRAGRDASTGLHFGAGDRVLVLGRGWDAGPVQAALAVEQLSGAVRVVQVIYDLVPVLLPSTVAAGFPARFATYLRELLTVSDGLVAISARTRADVLSFAVDHGLTPPTIETVRLGDTVPGAIQEPVAELESRRFILAVGTFEPRKNYWLLYQALKLAVEAGRELPRLVIVGRLGSATRAGVAHSALTRDPQLAGAVTVLHSATDGQLEWLYRACLFTVYPSLYEGWGLPVAEALSRGVPCIASSAGAIPEIGGELVDYCSPYDPAALLGLIERYLEPGFLDARRREIRVGYRGRSWDEAFEEFDAAVDRLAGGGEAAAAG